MELKTDNNFIVNRDSIGRDRYKLDGKSLTGVTTITGMQNKGFLVDWSAKEAYTHCLTLSDAEIKNVIKNKTYAHKNKSDHAKDKGKLAHDYVEKFVKNYIEKKQYIIDDINDTEVNTSVNRFYKWAMDNRVEFLGSEVSVYSKKYWYAGSFDFICKLNDKLLLGDFKTSKQTSSEYYAQCAGYAIAVEENNPEIKFDGVIIVRSILAEDGNTRYEKSSNGTFRQIKDEPFEVNISYNIEKEKAYFLSLLNIYHYTKGLDVKEWYEAEVVDYLPDDYPIDN